MKPTALFLAALLSGCGAHVQTTQQPSATNQGVYTNVIAATNSSNAVVLHATNWYDNSTVYWMTNSTHDWIEDVTTLKIPGTRPAIRFDDTRCVITLWKFTDAEWEILTNTFRERVVVEGTNFTYTFGGTNEWCKAHPAK